MVQNTTIDLFMLGLFGISGYFTIGRFFDGKGRYGQRIGRNNAWIGGLIAMSIGALVIYPWIIDVPAFYLTQATYAFNNLNTSDWTHPVNATAILYGSIVVYMVVLCWAIIRRFSAAEITLG